MPKLCRIAVASAIALLAIPSVAHGASIKVESALLGLLGENSFTYQAAPGEMNKVRVTQSGTTLTISEVSVPINVGSAGGLCLSLDATHVNCVVSSAYDIEFVTGDGDDRIFATATSDLRIESGSGSDEIRSGSGDDRLIGGGGNDVIRGGLGADRIEGEAGMDVADYADSVKPVSVTPDGDDNDGAVGEGDDVEDDVEGAAGGAGGDTLVAGFAGGTLLGRGGADTLSGAGGPDSLDGGAGIDSLSGAGGGDVIYSRDDFAESPVCGAGVDTVQADPFDSPSIDCETIEGLLVGEPDDTGGIDLPTDLPLGGDRSDGVGGGSTGGSGGDTSGSGSGGGDAGVDDTADPGLPAPPPERGVLVNAEPDSGSIRIKLPGSDEYLELTGDSGIPVGSVVDARHGTVSITSALDANGNTQTASFWGGAFKVRQRRNLPVVDIVLKGGDFSSCGRARAGSATAVTAGRRARRRLWSRDRRGRYRTKGRHSVATVRGTRWLTVDRCEGTLTRVTEGAVSVRPRGRGKRKLVRAGDSYLARRR